MKTMTLTMLLALSSLTITTAQASDKQVKTPKEAVAQSKEEMKCGPLADFYELVAMHPIDTKPFNIAAKSASTSSATQTLALLELDSSKDAQKMKSVKTD